MSTDLITGQAVAVANVPAYAQGASGLGDLGGDSFTRLTFKGSRFRIKKGDDEQVLKDFALDVVIVAAHSTVSRVYYEGAYDADTAGERPACASADGEVPLPTVAQPQSTTCQSCPMNEKGSSISDDGGKRKACGYFHRVVLRLVKYPDLGEVVAEVKALSLFGTSYPDANKLNFRMYADRLNSHQTMAHAVITQMTFDTNSSVPKLLFQPTGYVTEADFNNVYHPLSLSQLVLDMADTTTMRTGAGGDSAAPANAFREQLIAGEAPPALTGPPPLTETAANIAALQAQILEMQKPPAPPPPPPPPPPPAPVKTAAQLQIEALQAQIASMQKAPPTPEVVVPPQHTPVETEDEKTMRLLQAQIAAMTAKISATAPAIAPVVARELATTAVVSQPSTGITAGSHAHVNAHGVAWNPEYHSTSSEGQPVLNADGHYKARRGISAELKAKVKMPTGMPAVAAPAAAAIAPVVAAAVAPAAATPEVQGQDFDANLDAALAEFDA